MVFALGGAEVRKMKDPRDSGIQKLSELQKIPELGSLDNL